LLIALAGIQAAGHPKGPRGSGGGRINRREGVQIACLSVIADPVLLEETA